jgi:hypothetical protein
MPQQLQEIITGAVHDDEASLITHAVLEDERQIDK